MRRILAELALLTVAVALWIALVFLTTLRPVNHQTAWITWGYPFVWRSAASASPLYTYPLALYEDVAFWAVLSLAFVEFPIRVVAIYADLSLRKTGDLAGLPGVTASSVGRSPPTRSALAVATAVIIAAALISASVFVASGWGVTTTETVTTTGTLTTTSTFTTTSTVLATSPATVTTTSCTVSGPTEGVVIHVLANNYTGNGVTVIPVVGAKVSGQAIGYCNNVLQPATLQPTTTNSSGWASLLDGQFGLYDLQVAYVPTLVFNLSIVTMPTSVTYVTFNISTGNMTTHFCEFNVCRSGTG